MSPVFTVGTGELFQTQKRRQPGVYGFADTVRVASKLPQSHNSIPLRSWTLLIHRTPTICNLHGLE
ncbi:hypothetical protein GB937_003369 [Aspergillus fischeri]|nr:hypothetical protein GB937_003369 [Aspergillus fischeri]